MTKLVFRLTVFLCTNSLQRYDFFYYCQTQIFEVMKKCLPLQRIPYRRADEPACMQQAFFIPCCKTYTVLYPCVER